MDESADGAFTAFVATHADALVRSAFLLTGRLADAEDAVQSALLKVYLAWSRIERRDAALAYARRAVVREVIDVRRGPLRRVRPTERPPDVAIPSAAERVDAQDAMHAALLRLPPRQRAVLVLRYFDDLTEAQAADVLGIRVGSVKQHASRGLAHLRDVLRHEHEEVP
jgi:RNA polymerase sigma-70 factor (sigma-E family)